MLSEDRELRLSGIRDGLSNKSFSKNSIRGSRVYLLIVKVCLVDVGEVCRI